MSKFAPRTFTTCLPSSTTSITVEAPINSENVNISIEVYKNGWTPQKTAIELTPTVAESIRDLLNMYLKK